MLLSNLRACRDTVSGLSRRSRTTRPIEVSANFSRLADPAFGALLKDYLYGQDQAIDDMALHMATEALTRQDHQPLRMEAQGTPGTGKSAYLELTAEYLDIPYIQIDCASLPDTYAASTQVFGVAGGLVGSDRVGRLEEAALSRRGAVVEISDLDHAPPGVRAQLADQFLQALDMGEAQTGTGRLFSCAKLIMAFTMNLPDGRDGTLRSGFGFTKEPTREQVKDRVRTELRRILSGAFLSRVGDPIIFDPLDRRAYLSIIRFHLEKAVHAAASRLGYTVTSVQVREDAASRVLASLQVDVVSTGARGLAEFARAKAAQSLLHFQAKHKNGFSGKLSVKPCETNQIIQIIEE